MRVGMIGLPAGALFIVAAGSVAGPPHPPPPAPAQASKLMVPDVPPSLDSDKEAAGLAKGSVPATLTWERVYALALVRARSGRGAISPTLDPAALAAEAARQGVADFGRFRNDFLASGPAAGRAFRDPSAAVLDLLGRLHAIESARRNILFHERLNSLLVERVQGDSADLNRIDIDRVFASLIQARQQRTDDIRQFRDRLDELKFALGLSSGAAVILDRQSLAAFRGVFDSVESWARRPQRRLEALPRIIERLPDLGDVTLDGQPILAQLEIDPDMWEDILTRAARLAVKNRGEQDEIRAPANEGVQLELRVRRRIRSLFATARAYATEKRNYELAIRLKDQAFERLIAPRAGIDSSRSPFVDGLIEQVAKAFKAEDRLVVLWTSFRTERLALYRDLGVLPYNDWSSLYADLSAGLVAAAAVPGVAPEPRAGIAPQPPTPAAPPEP